MKKKGENVKEWISISANLIHLYDPKMVQYLTKTCGQSKASSQIHPASTGSIQSTIHYQNHRILQVNQVNKSRHSTLKDRSIVSRWMIIGKTSCTGSGGFMIEARPPQPPFFPFFRPQDDRPTYPNLLPPPPPLPLLPLKVDFQCRVIFTCVCA